MKIPKALQSLVEDGLIDEVIRPLMSGKEASVLVVASGGEIRCVKIYKESKHRSFKQRANYEEGRSVRNTRRARAMSKRSKFGKQELEDSWQNTEVDTIYILARAGVRVPKPHAFSEGVLLMELVVDANGDAAPRLNDVSLSPDRARAYHAFMLNQIVRMLCAGLVHGDLSEYNVLVGAEGPVVIDFPQAVNAAGNNSAKAIFLRDVDNMTAYFSRFAPEIKRTKYGKEIWKLYERGDLHPDVELTGHVDEPTALADVAGVLSDIEDAREDHERRLGRPVVQEPTEDDNVLDEFSDSDIEIAIKEHEKRLRRQVVDIAPSKANGPKRGQSRPGKEGGNRSGRRGPNSGQRAADSSAHRHEQPPSDVDGGPPKKKRRRRRRRGPSDGAAQGNAQGAAQTPVSGAPSGGGRPESERRRTQPPAGEGPPKKKRRRRRRRSSRPPGSNEGSSTS